ncbi:hypothetical protein GFS24_01705 [Chitinophaga sp. SYP-B3965]|uniref:hypothetical protein n=1 Tax=Chitinophaga sp. SYP-B3965 TaxID=2663120 RepID=UPI001299F5B0|nr:hypothetical protein [Chitinophaga sp. SYP-B3965]MRG43806.1 hypothetical protein [Chitinophaga sp. SYP-B3965]
MKRFLTALLAVFIFASSVSVAQTKPAAKKATTAVDTVHLKKDGTKDKRFKENKKADGPLKKDGTPDKRFKENKKKS